MEFNFKLYLRDFYTNNIDDLINKRKIKDENFLSLVERFLNTDVDVNSNLIIRCNFEYIKDVCGLLLLKKNVPVFYKVFDINSLVREKFDLDKDNILRDLKSDYYKYVFFISFFNVDSHRYLESALNEILYSRIVNKVNSIIVVNKNVKIDDLNLGDELIKFFNVFNFELDKSSIRSSKVI